MLVDTHCHLDPDRWAEGADVVLARARAAGVGAFLVVGVGNVAAARHAVDLAVRHGDVWAAVGVDPHVASAHEELWPEVAPLLAHDRVVALGEVGLDYHYDLSPRDQQREVFRHAVHAARRARLPLVIHTRDAADDTLEILRLEGAREVGGVIHCFDQDRAFARSALDLGFYLSFTGIVTFPSAKNVHDVALWAPLDRVLVETDSPYMSPVPVRKMKPCEPAFVVHTARRIAELRGLSLEAFIAATGENAARLFGKGAFLAP